MTLGWPYKKITQPYWLGLHLSGQFMNIAVCCSGTLKRCASIDVGKGTEALACWLNDQALKGAAVILTLSEDDYELLLVEAPEVEDDELSSAIAFRVHDLLPQPLEETAVQAFRLPADAYRGRMSMAYVVAAKNARIEYWRDWLNSLGLELRGITVPEISWLNVLAAHNLEYSVALLELTESKSFIRLYKAGAMYLSRQIDMGIDYISALSLEDESDLVIDHDHVERLVLEIQRSLDYFESQLGLGHVSHVWLMGGGRDLSSLVDAMQGLISINIEQPNLNKSVALEAGLKMQESCGDVNKSALALGGVLTHVAR